MSIDDVPGAVPDTRDAVRDAYIAELHRVYDTLTIQPTAALIAYIIVVFAGAVVAAKEAPIAFVSVPLLWSVWLLHAMVKDDDTQRAASYARSLEANVNRILGTDVYTWETQALAQKRGVLGGSSFVYEASLLYWMLLNLASWVAAVWILRDSDQENWGYVVIAVGVATYAVAGGWLCKSINRRRHERTKGTAPASVDS
jgi:hypothetical protein